MTGLKLFESASSACGHDARTVANYFVRLAKKKGTSISITQLVKLVYIAHGWQLGLNNQPLIRDNVEAWAHGPVVPVVYNAFRPMGTIIEDEFSDVPDPEDAFSGPEERLVRAVYDLYGDMTPIDLTHITHLPGTPWRTMYCNERSSPIPFDVIRDHYRELASKRKSKSGK